MHPFLLGQPNLTASNGNCATYSRALAMHDIKNQRHDRIPPSHPAAPCERLTLRSILIGTALVILISVGDPYSLYQLHSTMWGISYMPFCVVVLFMAVVLMNAAIARGQARWALTRTELMAIFIMGLVGASIPTWGTTSYLLSVIAAPHHYA